QVAHSEIDHPLPAHVAEVFRVLFEGGEGGGAGLLTPGLRVVVLRDGVDAEVALVPFPQRGRVLCPKEEAADSRHAFHALVSSARSARRLPLSHTSGGRDSVSPERVISRKSAVGATGFRG